MSDKTIATLAQRGVKLLSPQSISIADDVDLGRIHGPDTVLYPGTRLAGDKTLIMPGAKIGQETPATVINCAIGPKVSLKGGFFEEAVFLERASMGSAAHVRAGTLLEEQANAAHAVGLKHTILLPFVTLGSLINFCDALMAGGTSRRDHSEVGSSFIHFNFTPFGQSGDKATPSLIGDVPHGVMLRSRRIFLGGQAGLVGPTRIDYGTVLAAGFVYRRQHGPDQLVVGERVAHTTRAFTAASYTRIADKVALNLEYIGNLAALWHWYERVRLSEASGALQQLYTQARETIELAIEERIKRLGALAAYMDESVANLRASQSPRPEEIARQERFAREWPTAADRLASYRNFCDGDDPQCQALLAAYRQAAGDNYTDRIAALDDNGVAAATSWLQRIVAQATACLSLDS